MTNKKPEEPKKKEDPKRKDTPKKPDVPSVVAPKEVVKPPVVTPPVATPVVAKTGITYVVSKFVTDGYFQEHNRYHNEAEANKVANELMKSGFRVSIERI